MGALDLPSDSRRVGRAEVLTIPDKVGDADVLAAERHFDERANPLRGHIRKKVIGGFAAYVVKILISTSFHH